MKVFFYSLIQVLSKCQHFWERKLSLKRTILRRKIIFYSGFKCLALYVAVCESKTILPSQFSFLYLWLPFLSVYFYYMCIFVANTFKLLNEPFERIPCKIYFNLRHTHTCKNTKYLCIKVKIIRYHDHRAQEIPMFLFFSNENLSKFTIRKTPS